MSRVTVGLGTRAYDIVIEEGLIETLGQSVEHAGRGRFFFVTDSNVQHHLWPRIEGSVVEPDIVLPAGEATKSWSQLESLCDELLRLGIGRGDALVAVGGGVIGDLVGFAASILKRGCTFIQVPTTLLAQVDSSVGGKTAINTRAGKNLIGAFYQPSLVLIDPSALDTLPAREMRAGYAEVVKYGLIDNADFFSWCEKNGTALLTGNRAAQLHAIETSVRAKAAIVEADERETEDKRALLNLGHTFGHALEAETGFSDRLLHGEAVAAGMALAFRFSAATGRCPVADAGRVEAHLRSVDLPDGLEAAKVDASGRTLVAHMMHDKKMLGDVLPFILARGIGEAYVDRTVGLGEVRAFLDQEAR